MNGELCRVLHEIADAALGGATGATDATTGATSGDATRADGSADATVGSITLRPHQRAAVRQLRSALAEFGGALLADAPGLGKTYVALAVAARYPNVLVLAPAALRSLWRDSAERSEVSVQFISLESLSRRPSELRPGFVIVDEAHHVHHAGTARYRHLADLTVGAPLLLLTATPVRNRGTELTALLALFLGARAATLDDASRARCIVVRGAPMDLLPRVAGPVWHEVGVSESFSAAIAGLPPPLPVRDGREARAILAMGLVRAWASSCAALHAALTRRLQRGAALDAALELGRMPTRAELAAWVVGDDAVQLALPFVVEMECAAPSALRETLRTHLIAVRRLREAVETQVRTDCERRAALLRELRRRYAPAPVVAFSAYAATVDALFRTLRADAGVAALTSRGARSASGRRPRADVIDALGGTLQVRGHDAISLVLTTDLLSEGVNLQGAGVIVHLDVPWTPAALEQRVGRAARMQSRHPVVFVHGISPPRDAERALETERRLSGKRAAAKDATAAGTDGERLLAAIRKWRLTVPCDAPLRNPQCEFSRASSDCSVEAELRAAAVTTAERTGYLAVVESAAGRWVVGGNFRSNGANATRDPAQLADLAEAVVDTPVHLDQAIAATANRAVARLMKRSFVALDLNAAPAGDVARRAVLARADLIVARAPLHSRAEVAALVEQLRAVAATAVGAGAERRLADLARDDSLQDLPWLRHAAAELHRVARVALVAPTRSRSQTEWRVRALLLLIPGGAALPPPERHAPTSVGS